ncbi:unnamed protein product [Caenorhabditis angaria]|uniref:Uncharacterized protein n=1 Tax=Caenorhabditis angaria TaxID=860376 RepID=A0A9P1MWH8_9PELO|nr:unnamed protein product [Caenorhabditis angaria]
MNVETPGRKYSLGPLPSLPLTKSTPSSLHTAHKTSIRRFSLATTFLETSQRRRSILDEGFYIDKKAEESNPDWLDFSSCSSEIPFIEVPQPDSSEAAKRRRMVRAMRVVVVGAKKVGKTAILRQVACIEDITEKPYEPTIEDTYQVMLEEPDKARETLVLHDTAGISNYGTVELKKAYVQVADAFVLVYSSADYESFNRMDLLKKWIDRQFGKDKKEVPIVVLANMKDKQSTVDSAFAQSWAAREKVKLFEVSAKDRETLFEFIHYVGRRHFHPSKEKFSISKKLKSEKSANPAILMDF